MAGKKTGLSKIRQEDQAVDPFGARTKYEEPTVGALAAGIVENDDLLREVVRRALWVKPEVFQSMLFEMADRRDSIVAACKNGTFGRDYVAASVRPFTGREL